MGLKGWYCIGVKSYYFKGNKNGPATGKCGSAKAVAEKMQVVKDYVNAASSNFNYVQGCYSAIFVEGCIAVTGSGSAYWSIGVGGGLPGPIVSVDQTRGKSTNQTLTGWSTCADVGYGVDFVHCWNTPGNGSSNGVGVSGPSAGVFVTYGRRFGL